VGQQFFPARKMAGIHQVQQTWLLYKRTVLLGVETQWLGSVRE
jgi:hypothetical protein